MTYESAAHAFADADAKLALAAAIWARAEPLLEGSAGWSYLTRTRRLPAEAVRAALPELRLVEPLIEGRPPVDYALCSVIRDAAGEPSGFELAFIDTTGAPSAHEPRRQTYSLRPNGVRDGLFGPVGPAGPVAYLCEGRAAKPIALVAAGLGPVYGGGSRTVLGHAAPPEAEVVLVTDRRPDGKAGEDHDRDLKRAADLLLIADKAVSVTPDPPACPHGCKDADAVLVRHGAVLLADWVRQAKPVDALSLDGEARRLAGISDPLEREQATKAAAGRLKIRVTVLREVVRRYHDGEAEREPEAATPGSAMVFADLAPAAEPQDGAMLLDDVDAAVARYAFLAEADRTKVVLWSAHTHRRFLNNATVLPRLLVTATGEDSGKTTLAVAIAKLGDRMEHTTSPTAAITFRAIEAERAGFIFDEADNWWRRDTGMQEIINSGFTLEGASVLRTEDVGDGTGRRVLAPRRFSTFAPIAVVGINLIQLLPRPLVSRSLRVVMRPARPGEVAEDLLGERAAVAHLVALAGRVKRWVADNELALDAARPKLDRSLVNRVRLIWRPLLAIADRAGGDWPRRARAALAIDRGQARDPSLGEQMLLDVRDTLEGVGVRHEGDRVLHTTDLIEKLLLLELRAWSVFGRARVAIRDIDVAALLSPYEVRPEQIKLNGLNRRGYRLTHIEEAVARYVMHMGPEGPKSRYPATESDFPRETAAHEIDVPATKPATRPATEPATSINADQGSGYHPATRYHTRYLKTEENCGVEVSGSTVAAFAGGGDDIHSEDPTEGGASLTCEDCGTPFPRPPKGRPPKRCPDCRRTRRPQIEPGVVFE